MWMFGSMSMSTNNKKGSSRNDVQLYLLLAASALSLSFVYLSYRHMFGYCKIGTKREDDDDDNKLDSLKMTAEDEVSNNEDDVCATSIDKKGLLEGKGNDDNDNSSMLPIEQPSRSQTPVMSNTSKQSSMKVENDAPAVPGFTYEDLEALDKKGKAFFKEQKYAEAADCFTQALEIGEELRRRKPNGSVMTKQERSLLNNRSAMYEKKAISLLAKSPERNVWIDLSLADVDTLLSYDSSHMKTRQRKLRLLEKSDPPKYFEALVEVCAMQLLYMKEHRDVLRMGIQPSTKPPVDQEKIESLMANILPSELEKVAEVKRKEKESGKENPIPCANTIISLLKSFRGYNSWMSTTAKDLDVAALTKELESLKAQNSKSTKDLLTTMGLFLRRGKRYAFEKNFVLAVADFDDGMKIVEKIASSSDKSSLLSLEANTNYPRLLEWAGLSCHLRYDLDKAAKLYDTCSELEPTNAELLVKRAGVSMDAEDLDKAKEMFQTALGLEPDSTDALLHRSNLYMMQGKLEEAKSDLQRCVLLKHDFTLAYLRLATLHMMSNNISDAMKSLDSAETFDPASSEIHSYRGELCFTQGDIEKAKEEFDIAMKNNPNNPNAYVNAALAVMNTQTSTGMPDFQEGIRLLSKAIEIDPQAHSGKNTIFN